MEGVLQVSVGGRGQRAAFPLVAEVLRELAASDLALLEAPREIKTPVLKNIRESHHALARYLARGLKHVEVSAITGYSPNRISILLGDPAFSDLVETYRQMEIENFSNLGEQLASLSADAVAELRERLTEEPEKVTYPQLLATAELLLDRTGHGPVSTTTANNKSVSLTGEEIERIKNARKAHAPASYPPRLENSEGTPHSVPRLTGPSNSDGEAPNDSGTTEGDILREASLTPLEEVGA